MGRDVQVRDSFGAISPGTGMVPCWLVWRVYKPKSETKPIQCVARKTNQRTSGPVNAHLIAGPGIYFNAFIHVYSPRAGADNPLVTNVDANRNPISLCPFVAGLKKKML